MNSLRFKSDAWAEYIEWQSNDKKALQKINILIKDIIRNPFSGIGKPEPLKHDLSGYISRRIDDKNRLIYSVSENEITIISCRGHYH